MAQSLGLHSAEVEPAQESAMDYRQHERTYTGFVHLIKWFVIHMTFDLVGLYFAIIEGNPLGALVFVALGTAIVVFGVLSTPKAAEEAPIVEPRPADARLRSR